MIIKRSKMRLMEGTYQTSETEGGCTSTPSHAKPTGRQIQPLSKNQGATQKQLGVHLTTILRNPAKRQRFYCSNEGKRNAQANTIPNPVALTHRKKFKHAGRSSSGLAQLLLSGVDSMDPISRSKSHQQTGTSRSSEAESGHIFFGGVLPTFHSCMILYDGCFV